MINDFFYQLELAIDGSVSDLSLPGGSVGNVLNGFLRLPARAAQLVAHLAEDFGS